MLIFMEGGKPDNLEKNPRGTGENNTSNKLNSHMILPKPGLEPGTIEDHYATHATHLLIILVIYKLEYSYSSIRTRMLWGDSHSRISPSAVIFIAIMCLDGLAGFVTSMLVQRRCI